MIEEHTDPFFVEVDHFGDDVIITVKMATLELRLYLFGRSSSLKAPNQVKRLAVGQAQGRIIGLLHKGQCCPFFSDNANLQKSVI